MMHKLLIANRGEIALRIQHACDKIGLPYVQAASQADMPARYVQQAQDAICIGAARARESYLDIPALIFAAKATGCTMLHPGYGFLSENAAFAAAVADEGLMFVGPPAAAIRTMGDKIRARQVMLDAGVPCIPGSPGALPDDAEALHDLARQIGYPVIVKAAGGGGGRGMRVVLDEVALNGAVALTREEARTAFGNPELYMERYLTTPRHVELQILCDGHGNAVHLGDRDCSMQRRHQKIIEEAPAPGVSRDLIERVAERCLVACKSMGYSGAGTFEFLYEDGEMFFIEMNTRLQVEHPITEMITGIDIVEAQLLIAMGQPLAFTQSDVTFTGHAVECRINAEDPVFMLPSPGKVTVWQMPEGPGLRVDTHLSQGDDVPPYYDSLIGKFIAHGPDRATAIARMQAALDSAVVGGIKTNIPLHQDLMRDDTFLAGGAGINYLEAKMNAEAER